MLYVGNEIMHSALLALFAIPLVLVGLTIWDPVAMSLSPRRDLYLPHTCDLSNIGIINSGFRIVLGGIWIASVLLTINIMTYIDALVLFGALLLIFSGIYRWDPVVALLQVCKNGNQPLMVDGDDLLSKSTRQQNITTTRWTENRYSSVRNRVA